MLVIKLCKVNCAMHVLSYNFFLLFKINGIKRQGHGDIGQSSKVSNFYPLQINEDSWFYSACICSLLLYKNIQSLVLRIIIISNTTISDEDIEIISTACKIFIVKS